MVTDGLKAFVEVHEIGRLRDSGGVGFRKGLDIFNGGLTFNSGGFLDLVSLGRGVEEGLEEQPGWVSQERMLQTIGLKGAEPRGTSGVVSSAVDRVGRTRRAVGVGRSSGDVSG